MTLRRVAIYCLDSTLDNMAKEVRRTFQSLDEVHCPYRLHLDHHIISIKDEALRLRNSVQGTNGVEVETDLDLDNQVQAYPSDNVHVDILSFGHLAALLKCNSERVYLSGNHYDVVLILGHSSIFTIGPFSTTEILHTYVNISSPHAKPSIVALLGCCSGNARYGPVSTLQGLQNLNTIFAFY